jgi:hypothetical protein
MAISTVALVALVALFGFASQPISRRRGRERAAAAGAIWSGLANFDVSTKGQAPIVVEAFSDLGSLYGASLVGEKSRPLSGQLYVSSQDVWWEPGLWPGRGRPRGWRLERLTLRAVDIEEHRPGALLGYTARLRTETGDISFTVVDPEGLSQALRTITG